MASLAIGLAGAAIGGSIGGSILGISATTIGFAAGSLLGSAIDTALFTEPTDGSKTSEFYITVSTYGAAIPILYGGRISGNIIWAGDVIEEKDEQTSDVFFGLFEVTTAIEYKYYATFAVSLGEGVVTSVDQIWADGTLVYDPAAGVASIDFTLHPGSEDQTVDPDIEAKEGTGNAPAYRGQAYVVVRRLYLGDWGNRIPNLTFAVTTTTKYGGA